MSARLDQPPAAIFRSPSAGGGFDVPPPVDYLGSNCPEYDRWVNALFFAPCSPGAVSAGRRIRLEWKDSAWQAALRWKAD